MQSSDACYADKASDPQSKRFLIRNNFTTMESEESTHLSMQGGMYCVPDEHRDRYDELYCKDFERGEKNLSRIDMISPVFPLYFDLDYGDRVVTEEQTMLLCRQISVQVSSMYEILLVRTSTIESLRRFAYVISTCTETSNAHLHFPYLPVDRPMGIRITKLIPMMIHPLRLPGFEDASIEELQKVFDIAVLTTARSLRTIFSNKFIDCPFCSLEGCDRCDFTKSIAIGSGRIYDARFMAQLGHPIKKINPAKVDALTRLKITRVYIPKAEKAKACVPSFTAEHIRLLRKVEAGEDAEFNEWKSSTPLPASKLLPLPKTRGKKIPHSLATELMRCTRKLHPHDKSKRTISTISRNAFTLCIQLSGKVPCYNLVGKNRSHRGRSGYFVVNLKSGEMRQHCGCKCVTTDGRLNGLCSEYSSPKPVIVKLPDDLFQGIRSMSMMMVRKRKRSVSQLVAHSAVYSPVSSDTEPVEKEPPAWIWARIDRSTPTKQVWAKVKEMKEIEKKECARKEKSWLAHLHREKQFALAMKTGMKLVQRYDALSETLTVGFTPFKDYHIAVSKGGTGCAKIKIFHSSRMDNVKSMEQQNEAKAHKTATRIMQTRITAAKNLHAEKKRKTQENEGGGGQEGESEMIDSQ